MLLFVQEHQFALYKYYPEQSILQYNCTSYISNIQQFQYFLHIPKQFYKVDLTTECLMFDVEKDLLFC